MINSCPCKSSLLYSVCCQRFIEGKEIAPTAEKLMRSRYTAFTQANADYLMNTHHSSTRPLKEKKQIKKWAASVQWLGLQILRTQAGLETVTEGMVEFKAIYQESGKLSYIHEVSEFIKEEGKWYYVKGKHV